jgi:hypothetical protein
MGPTRYRSLAAALAGVCVVGAGGAGQPTVPEPPTPQPAGSGIDALVRAARADAAQRTGWPSGDFELVRAEMVTWRDGSLGCPAPDRLYTMALVPGYRVVLRARDQVFDYHAGLRGGPVLCPPGRAVEPLPDDRR